MSGGTTADLNPASKSLDVHHTDSAEPHQNKQPVKDKRAYGQVYLARARIEGIEKWRAAVDAALQGAEEDCHGDPEQRGTNLNMNRRRSEEAMQQKEKTEAAEDQVVLGVCVQSLAASSFVLMTLTVSRMTRRKAQSRSVAGDMSSGKASGVCSSASSQAHCLIIIVSICNSIM
jgi:hypothetical protein